MTFKAAPARTALSDTYPNPSNAVMRTGAGALWDWATSLLGTTGDPADARTALIAAKSGANSDITSLSALASINGGPLAGMRNRIINGNFSINQRAVSGTVTLAAGAYGHDRWKAGASGCTYTFATSGNDTTITISAGSLMQVVEDKNIEGGVYALSHSGTAQARIAVNGAATSGSYATASLAAPLLSASATGGQQVTVEFSTGTVSKVQFEPGTVATSFERRDYGDELRRCQRYYEVGKLGVIASIGRPTDGVAVYGISFKVEKRAAPSISGTSDATSSTSSITTNGFVYQATPGPSASIISGYVASAEI